jgi:methionyl-tRNA formyltransferase
MVQAVATTDRSIEMMGIMRLITQQGGVPSKIFSRDNFESDLISWLKQFNPDVVLVKTFPFRIPSSALRIPKYGFINFHYAPLPEYRGSNPLFWMIKNGVTQGGVAIHRMDEEFDTGPILLQQKVDLPVDGSFGLCSTVLGHTATNLCVSLVNSLLSGTINETPQNNEKAVWFGRPKHADLLIHWNSMSAQEVKRLVNACNPWLKGASTRWKGIPVNITDVSVSEYPLPNEIGPGTVIHASENGGLIIACKDKTAIKAESIYLEQGFYAGHKLIHFGLKSMDRFE